MIISNHFFHLVNFSPWPILIAFNLINIGSRIVIIILNKELTPAVISIILVLIIKFQWWRDVIREALYEGIHSKIVKRGIRIGVISFIISELCFFVSFFWIYFYLSLRPDIAIGIVWPPTGIKSVNFIDIPLLNTLILLASGFFITWSHYSLIKNSAPELKISYTTAIVLGIYFFVIQIYEYYELSFDLRDRAFGRSFFILTGFHGFHVLVGILFISINFKRLLNNSFRMIYPIGFEYSIWYWHFVDVVWLFLYLFLYWWGI